MAFIYIRTHTHAAVFPGRDASTAGALRAGCGGARVVVDVVVDAPLDCNGFRVAKSGRGSRFLLRSFHVEFEWGSKMLGAQACATYVESWAFFFPVPHCLKSYDSSSGRLLQPYTLSPQPKQRNPSRRRRSSALRESTYLSTCLPIHR